MGETDQSTTGILTLSRGAGRCDLIPAIGAASPPGRSTVRDDAFGRRTCHRRRRSFRHGELSLVPYSNRIGDGSFEWDGERFALGS